ncbi:hypothetical protein DL764_003047 [Monosporascus ibericus]|uniref:Cytochrome P450 n=1 Tax=Monosporascus ibericus TaxID=155417 RepID=A0A4Q4TI47_9PEZI|nr:hypothetical protein DL764_003047 [Monosporascus ibericus]
MMPHHIVLAASTGLLAHNAIFIRGEWHMRIPHIVAGHCLLGSFAWYSISQSNGDGSLREASQAFAVMVMAYLTALFGSMTVYRLFFHRCTKFPGPKLAAVTKLWHIWHIRKSTNFSFLKELHEKYGNIIRTGPNEITLVDPAAYQLLDGWGTSTTRDVWYDVLRPRYSAVFSRDEDVHRKGPMNAFHPRIVKLAQSLSSCIKAHGTSAVDVDEVMSWFSFDVMGDIVFGKDFNLLESRVWTPAIEHRDRALALVGPIGDTIWIARLAFWLVPFYGRVKDWFRMVSFCEDQIKERLERGKDKGRVDMSEYFLDEYQMHSREKTLQDRNLYLGGTITTAVVAGSDTSRAALIASCWYLAKYPEHASKIRDETRNVDLNDTTTLASLPHLNGFINETLRLVPPIMTGTSRITGPDGLMLDDVLIPPYTRVTTPRYAIMRMESAFPQPDDFIPERWYSRPELIRDKRAFAPFSVGGRQCVGRTVAYTEVRCVTALLLRDYDIEFAPGYDPMTMWRDMKDQVTAQPGQVRCLFKPRGV